MTTRSSAALPVQVLEAHISSIEKAMQECLHNPAPKSVHRLRTSTRRIEGQLALLAALPDPPQLQDEVRLLRALKRARRKAGRVRDLDVEEDLLAKIAGKRSAAKLVANRNALMARLEHKRAEAAGKLTQMLHERGEKLSVLLRSALDDLKPHHSLSIEGVKLAQLAQNWFSLAVREEDEKTDDIERLHDIRKIAKLARYMAENAPRSTSARRAATAFEDLQQAGGEWHDWLVLAGIAEDRLGDDSPLAGLLKRRCLAALKVFRKLLSETLHQTSEGSLSRAGATAGRRPRALRRT